jgi:hypothetical protein
MDVPPVSALVDVEDERVASLVAPPGSATRSAGGGCSTGTDQIECESVVGVAVTHRCFPAMTIRAGMSLTIHSITGCSTVRRLIGSTP